MEDQNKNFLNWEIIHIPGKLLTQKDSIVNVVAAQIEPKLAHNLIRQLNQIFPLESLRHVKRVRKTNLEGKIELSIILCICEDENSFETIPSEVSQFISSYNLNPFNAKVSRYEAISKEEWEEQCKLWPTSFHPPTNPEGVSQLDEKEMNSIYNFMKIAIQLTIYNDKARNAAIIVDPSKGKIISKAEDQTLNISENSKSNPKRTKFKFSENQGVACINPWGWKSSCHNNNNDNNNNNSFKWHPLRHAAMVAIEKSSELDRKLFPDFNPSVNNYFSEVCSENCPMKKLKTDMEYETSRSNRDLVNDLERPYLCTGYDIYLVWEPCPMCAMALVHQRIKRIFYAIPNLNAGALESVHRLHGEKSLNHHYSVFRILIPEKSLDSIISDELEKLHNS
ncbi:hypothetical protein LUZ60_008844 [Juncus effusus]|nr:hypothetical protein LUZ60_008844 [Juncus effusus]